MGRNGEGEEGAAECCMCGDYGLSSELFTCKHCRFRSQHKYCSNLYPEAESYNLCNWCLSEKNIDTKGEENAKSTSPNSSSMSHKARKDDEKMNKSKRVLGGVKDIKKGSNQMIKIKQNKFPADRSNGGIAKRIIRTRSSDEISNGGIIIKQVFRNKVRRYKLLDEVSS